ncbi:TonB-dependent receptor [Fulvivirga sediminis]|uniref:TonB-dependent receptor n=1 Tax=Fulvivirga sediminis TaxID=2803949 RepID=A0A937K2F1_9BACT|nr:TonB-dependent receptor [Fulvivirga sediminis]MBL3658526.1 TonB-dependent receptor [Fulvivirga sediminis]
MKTVLLSTLLAVLSIFPSFAQEKATISGVVKSSEGEIIPDAYLFIDKTNFNAISDAKGNYELKVPAGKYLLVCTVLGFEREVAQVDVEAGTTLIYDFTLTEKDQVLDEVEITGKSIIQEVKESPYNVVAIDTKKLENSSKDLSQALERSSGVRIRRSGGQGSRTSVMLNGFTGRHVKIFMDGLPMQSYGSAFQINNIPVNLAERIEVYKGVVPIELGADALGGAINIITKKSANTYLDASYSYGSFNTHKTNINFGSTSKSGFTFNVNAFQNYSDNNYDVKTQLLEFTENADGSYSSRYSNEEQWFERFHDTYHNETVIAKVGFVKKPWADRFLIGATLAQEESDIQNANIMQIAYGGRATESHSVIPSLEYYKSDLFIKNLSLAVSANYSRVKQTNIDTMARQYNWAGDYRPKGSRGEGDYSMGEFRNNTGMFTANLKYKIGEKQQIVVNNLWSTFERKNSDPVANDQNSSDADFMKRSNTKNVLGISYDYQLTDKWNASLFGKNYHVVTTGPMDTTTVGNTPYYQQQNRRYSVNGFGLVTNYRLKNDLLLKMSFERSVRLPTSTELFGDEVLETGTTDLEAENSRNVNFNVTYAPSWGVAQKQSLYIDAGFIYRDTEDYIRRDVSQSNGLASYVNHGKVQNVGVDLEVRYFYKRSFAIGGTFTYQNMRDKVGNDQNGRPSLHYNDRMRNVPYLFGNGEMSYMKNNLFGKGDKLTVTYFLNYVHAFYRDWPSLGSKKIEIPEQLSHDMSVNYSMKRGKYNITLEANNFTDTILYDNYSLQKPGRSFSVKLRYFFSKSRS